MYGDEQQTISEWECRRLLLVAVLAAIELQSVPSVPGQPVITSVEPVGTAGNQPLLSGQVKFVMTLNVSVHPSAS